MSAGQARRAPTLPRAGRRLHVLPEQARRGVVEVVSVRVRDDDRVQRAHYLLRRERERNERVPGRFGEFTTGGRAPASSSIGSTSTRRPSSSSSSVALRIKVNRRGRTAPDIRGPSDTPRRHLLDERPRRRGGPGRSAPSRSATRRRAAVYPRAGDRRPSAPSCPRTGRRAAARRRTRGLGPSGSEDVEHRRRDRHPFSFRSVG